MVKIASRSWVDVFQLAQHASTMVALSTLTSLVRKSPKNAVNVQTRILKAKIVSKLADLVCQRLCAKRKKELKSLKHALAKWFAATLFVTSMEVSVLTETFVKALMDLNWLIRKKKLFGVREAKSAAER